MKQTVTSSLAADAYTAVKKRLVRGEMALGQAISRRKLAAELGMSLLPVTIALHRLEHEGFVESRARAGTRVRIPSREDLHGYYVVREALETQAAKLFAMNATRKERDELKRLGALVDLLSTGHDRVRYVASHQQFHRFIADGAHCELLASSIEHTHALASVWFCAMRERPLLDPPRRHQSLGEIIAGGDPQRAAEAMREHIESGLRHVKDALRPYFALRRKSSRTFPRLSPHASH